jgi:SAM-dependent methyltransferase
MSKTQRSAYEHRTEIDSDPLGVIDRDNRNHRKKRQIIVDHMAADPGDTLLEIGCGDGLHAIVYDRYYEYTGVDLSESLAAETNRRIDDGVALQMDATDLSFETDFFQATVGTAVWHHMPDPVTALEEWRRVTAPGGSVTLMEPNYLFPKEVVETQVIPEERHKSNMAPWRVRRFLDDVDGVEWTHEPRLFTLPWPHKFFGIYDRIDEIGRKVPGFRWMGLMQLIHGVVE